MNLEYPEIISYNSVCPFDGKHITINEKENHDRFIIKRIYWINYDNKETTYSNHAHKTLKQIIVAVSGEVNISLESPTGDIYHFQLNEPDKGLFIPSHYWKKIEYSKPSILLCLASEHYDEYDYIRSYEDFKNFQK